ncbi:MAG: methionine--tRNA ligase [Candidatus Omnitrophota bacterium]
MEEKFYITTPLYYVNASPHIGHSYTNIAADCLARYMRRRIGYDKVWLLTGTDEHGQKIQKAAADLKLRPEEFVDKMVIQFQGLWKSLGITHNDFIRTSEKRHIETVNRVLEILHKKGDIYEDRYEGLYCTPCETFWLDSQVDTGSLCSDCARPLERISEVNYFFRLSRYQDWLIAYIQEHPLFIGPKIRRNEVLSFLTMNKLSDLCISRPKERLGWGIPLPFSPDHVTYVWFDALINYISAVGSFDKEGRYNSPWWPADLHLMAKDILRQHAVYWPIMLYALGIPLPRTIFAHGWWMIGESKMSKSRGNVVSPLDMIKRFGIDTYRYFLLRDISFGADGNFSEEAIVKRFNSDLANDLGNLVYRTFTMVEKYFQGDIPVKKERGILGDNQAEAIKEKMEALSSQIERYMRPEEDFNFSLALGEIWSLIGMANKYIEDMKPWNLLKENKIKELEAFILLLVDVIRKVADEASPFLPETSVLIQQQIGEGKINKGRPLFPRIETAKPEGRHPKDKTRK